MCHRRYAKLAEGQRPEGGFGTMYRSLLPRGVPESCISSQRTSTLQGQRGDGFSTRVVLAATQNGRYPMVHPQTRSRTAMAFSVTHTSGTMVTNSLPPILSIRTSPSDMSPVGASASSLAVVSSSRM